MALDTIDNLRDNLINAGIGDSGLTTQAIQRANIEELRSLRGAIQESQATRDNEDETRRNQLLADFARNQSSILAGGGNNRSSKPLDPSRPTLRIQNLTGPEGTRSFSISGSDGTNPLFTDVNQVLEYLQNNPTISQNSNLVLDGLQRLAPEELKSLQNVGVIPVATAIAKKLTDTGGDLFGGIQRFNQQAALVSDPAKATSQKPQEFDINKLDTNSRARLVSGTYDRLASQAKQGIAMTEFSAFKAALRVGKAGQIVQAMVRGGKK